MAHEQITEQIGVGSIVFGAATEEGFTIISQLAGVDRIGPKLFNRSTWRF
jgi:hypothetical protein